MRRAILTLATILFVISSISLPFPQTAAVQEARFFPETSFYVSNPMILDYVSSRGGFTQFGFPISREFTLLGDRVQFFQRYVVQIRNGAPTIMNLLDQSVMPYTSINGAVLPGVDPALAAAAPAVGSPDYAVSIVDFIKESAPDSYQGLPVNFGSAFSGAVRLEDAFPQGDGNPALLPLLNMELWGIPISNPSNDPNNFNFVYQRFQRNIMHYDASSGRTQGLLLAQYFKALITGIDLPPDLEEQGRNSQFYRQYNNDKPLGLNRPDALPGTNMKGAFEPEYAPGVPTPTPTWTPTPTLTPTPGPATPTPFVAGSGCNFDSGIVFVPEYPQPGNVVTITVTSPTAYSSVNLVGPGSPHFIGAGGGLSGYVWKWRVLVTEGGLYNYDFFVNANQLCYSGFFHSGGATPTPTKSPTPTITPSPTPSVTPSPTATPVAPNITNISPNASQGARPGDTITLTGTSFGSAQSVVAGSVIIGGVVVTQTLGWSDNSIYAVVPWTAPTTTTQTINVQVQVIARNVGSTLFPYWIHP
ncbi:MAG: hypothetical protein HYY30_11395 [Chloroflexi bacterium]|nr:hypothetical protein [Chloroflexota bacterium]